MSIYQARFNFECSFAVGDYITLTGRLCTSLNGDMYLYVMKLENIDSSIDLFTERSTCAVKILDCVRNKIGHTNENLSFLNLEKYV